jgi:hypothetical protein
VAEARAQPLARARFTLDDHRSRRGSVDQQRLQGGAQHRPDVHSQLFGLGQRPVAIADRLAAGDAEEIAEPNDPSILDERLAHRRSVHHHPVGALQVAQHRRLAIEAQLGVFPGHGPTCQGDRAAGVAPQHRPSDPPGNEPRPIARVYEKDPARHRTIGLAARPAIAHLAR